MSDELNLSDMNWCKREIESLQQQLATAIAACKLKDEALQSLHDEKCDYMRLNKLGNPYLETNTKLAVKALAVQPDDSALKAWLGQPVARLIPVALQDGYRVWARTFDEYSQESSENNAYRNGPEIPLYSPKVLP